MHNTSMTQSPGNISDAIAILWRRKRIFLISALVLFAISLVVLLFLPPTYQSKATILIKEPVVAGEIFDSAAFSSADQRVQVITQDVLSRSNLIKLIEKFELYPEYRDKNLLVAAAEDMRENIAVEFISAEVSNPQRDRPGVANIAFSLSFNHEDPQTAQAVADELVSLYLSENLRSLKERASQTSEFLAEEADKLGRQISELEANLATFKQKNSGSLPDQVALNQQAIQRIELQLLDLRHQIQSQEERKVYLESQLAQVSPYASITLDDGTVLRPEERLRKLEAEYSQLSNIYGPKHPKMIELSTEMETLRGKMGISEGALPEEPNNPAYLQLQTEVKAVKSNLASLRSEQSDLAKQIESLEGQNLNAPDVEREYLQMTRNYENATAEYRAVKQKLWDAERLESLESEQKGEHLSVIESPEVPLKPIAPKRKLLLVLGFVVSVFGGIGAVGIAEAADQSVSSPQQLTAMAGAAPLVVIPHIKAGKRRAFSTPVFLMLGLTVALTCGLLAAYKLDMPLEDLRAGLGLKVGSS